jgi:hypothetical protein
MRIEKGQILCKLYQMNEETDVKKIKELLKTTIDMVFDAGAIDCCFAPQNYTYKALRGYSIVYRDPVYKKVKSVTWHPNEVMHKAVSNKPDKLVSLKVYEYDNNGNKVLVEDNLCLKI